MECQASSLEQCVEGGLGGVFTAQRGRLVAIGELGEEDDLDAALLGELLQRGSQWLRLDFQLVTHGAGGALFQPQLLCRDAQREDCENYYPECHEHSLRCGVPCSNAPPHV